MNNIHASRNVLHRESRLPDRLRGVVLPEISRIDDLVVHTGLDAEVFLAELDSGRLSGVHLASGWLIHRRSLEAWLTREEGI